MSLRDFVTLGHSGLKVSPFCLGTMTFGEDYGWGSSVADSEAILARYLELGGNFLDTANGYTRGHSEKIIGDYLKKSPGRRDRLTLATKFYSNAYSGDPNAGGASRKAIHGALENSLRRLQTDYVDLYWMHCHDPFTPIEETMRTLDDVVRAGKVRYIGFSDTPAWKTTQAQLAAQVRGWTPLVALQIEYSLLERTVEGELIPMARELGLGVTPWSPLRSGALSGKYRRDNHGKIKGDRGDWVHGALTEHAYDVVEVLVKVAKEVDSTPARVALAWVQGRPGVASTIIGARTLAQLEDNVAALEVKLTEGHRQALDEISTPVLDFPARFIERVVAMAYSGTSVNGHQFPVNPMAPVTDKDRY